MKLSTKRLELRPFIESDLDDLFLIYSHEETCRYLLHNLWTEDNKEAEFF